VPRGSTAYPFSFEVPEHIQASACFVNNQIKGNMGVVMYTVCARLTHNGQKVAISEERELKIVRKADNSKFPIQKFEKVNQVGGMFGYFQSPSFNMISINRSEVVPGDQITIRITTDNTKS